MRVLLMAATLRDQLPAVLFEQPDELAELHAIDRAEGLGWAMSRRVRSARASTL